jgi:translation initiation factor IF-1
MHSEGQSVDSLINFLTNLMENPSHTSVQELYSFLEENTMPITPDGHFLAYKKVRYLSEDKVENGVQLKEGDMVDIHSGTFRNNPGDVVEMPRNLVNDNRADTCSHGLHFARLSYMPKFGNAGDPIVLVKINPRDVVSIPSDYNNAKGRCCRYEVISKHSGDQYTPAFTKSVVNEGELTGE